MAITSEDVILGYKKVLGRVPESEKIINVHRKKHDKIEQLIIGLLDSEEFKNKIAFDLYSLSNRFYGYNSSIDVPGIINKYCDEKRTSRSGCLVNYLGVLIPIHIMKELAERDGALDNIPIPSNFHADMAEWAGVLRSVDLANKEFSMIELGCGWGCWMINSGVSAKRKGCSVKLVGVEGDNTHIERANSVLKCNQFRDEEYSIIRGIASWTSGRALFPLSRIEKDSWGEEPIFDDDLVKFEKAKATGDYEELPLVPLFELLSKNDKYDLIHLDIQGGEADLIKNSINELTDKVSYMVIGTHSRSIEGELFDILNAAKWDIEIERPSIFDIVEGVPITIVDGVQAWRNRN